MLFDLQEAEFSREIIQHADRTIMVADATKFGRHAPVRVENPGVVDALVTDAAPPQDIATFLGEAGVRVVVAQKHA
jgi:DeoR family glycerol-3-phosphate regulon repressor